MTATTPPMTAWYVLEVDGTGLASAQEAEREKAKREREREEGVLRSPCGSPRASPGAPGGHIQLDPGAVEVKRGQEQSQGGCSEGEAAATGVGEPCRVSTAVGNPRHACALVLRHCSAVTVPEGWEGMEPRG